MIRRPPVSTRTDTLFPYTTLFRSRIIDRHGGALIDEIRTGRAADERRPKFQPVGGIKVQVQAGEQKGAIVFHAEGCKGIANSRSEEHTSELQSLMRISYAVFCLKKKKAKKKV